MNWPFRNLANTLNLVLDAKDKTKQTQQCNIDSSTSSGGSLVWFTITMDGNVMYGQFADGAVIDERIRKVTFALNPDGSVTATLPHFWVYAEMDPSYSILLGGNTTDPCAPNVLHHGKNIKKLVYIVVFSIIGGLVILGVAAYLLYPRIRLYRQLKRGHEPIRMNSLNGSQDMVIEKRGDMEVNTAAGRYVVPM